MGSIYILYVADFLLVADAADEKFRGFFDEAMGRAREILHNAPELRGRIFEASEHPSPEREVANIWWDRHSHQFKVIDRREEQSRVGLKRSRCH